jgi:hypothetical protein
MFSTRKKCGASFTTGSRTLTCDRSGPHLRHRDAATGDQFVRAPGGAVITPSSKS